MTSAQERAAEARATRRAIQENALHWWASLTDAARVEAARIFSPFDLETVRRDPEKIARVYWRAMDPSGG
jgi:hypothetical protein